MIVVLNIFDKGYTHTCMYTHTQSTQYTLTQHTCIHMYRLDTHVHSLF